MQNYVYRCRRCKQINVSTNPTIPFCFRCNRFMRHIGETEITQSQKIGQLHIGVDVDMKQIEIAIARARELKSIIEKL